MNILNKIVLASGMVIMSNTLTSCAGVGTQKENDTPTGDSIVTKIDTVKSDSVKTPAEQTTDKLPEKKNVWEVKEMTVLYRGKPINQHRFFTTPDGMFADSCKSLEYGHIYCYTQNVQTNDTETSYSCLNLSITADKDGNLIRFFQAGEESEGEMADLTVKDGKIVKYKLRESAYSKENDWVDGNLMKTTINEDGRKGYINYTYGELDNKFNINPIDLISSAWTCRSGEHERMMIFYQHNENRSAKLPTHVESKIPHMGTFNVDLAYELDEQGRVSTLIMMENTPKEETRRLKFIY